MVWYVYVLLSKNGKKSYVGSTNNLVRRLKEHNEGRNYFSKRYKPWEVIYLEEYNNEKEARVEKSI